MENTHPKIFLLDNKARERIGKTSADCHLHEKPQMLAGISGILEVNVGGKRFNLRVGDVMIIGKLTPHSVKPILPFTSTITAELDSTTLFSERLGKISDTLALALTRDEKSFVYLRREDEKTAEIFSIITKMYDENAKKDKCYDLFIKGYSKILEGLLMRHEIIKDVSEGYDISAISKLESVFEYVDNNLTREITLEEVAETLDMSREYFCRLFKKTVGKTFVDYVNFARINRAQKLLISTQESVSDISNELGFSSVSYFTRVFKSITNDTPASYRNIRCIDFV